MNNNVEFDVAEVLGYDHTYDWVPYSDSNDGFNNNNLFALKVRSCSGYIDRKTFIARPANNNIKKIPLIGEIVLLFKSYNQYASNNKTREIWYYLDTINIQSSINENRLPGLSLSRRLRTKNLNQQPGRTFDEEKIISPLQPYEGDMLLEGRFGNSIRFGSTISTVPENYVHKSPSWTGDVNGDPIIILSNGRDNLEDKEFVIENIETDKSSLYLTTTQKINNLTFSTSTSPTNFNNNFNGSNLIGIADRVILRSKTNQTIIDSEKDIILNTPSKVMIGDSSANQTGIPQGDQLVDVLTKIVKILAKGNLVQGSIASPLDKVTLKTLTSDIQKIKSKKYSIEKN